MLPAKLTAPPLCHYCRTPDGLWIKSERVPNAVRVCWQARTRVDAGALVELDAQGEECQRTGLRSATYPDPWQLAGEILADASIVEIAGLQDFDWFQFGLARHAAELIRLGYGDTPQEVMGWFTDLRAADYIRAGEYRVVGPERGPFRALGALRLIVDDRWPEGPPDAVPDPDAAAPPDPRLLTGIAVVGDEDEFPFEFPLDEVQAAFTIATVPV